MALILAIESDRRQINHLTALVRSRLHAELVLGDSAEAALERLGDRVPDLILTTPLLSPKDEQALGDRLRKLNGVAAHVQTLTLPLFAPPVAVAPPQSRGGMFSALLGESKPEWTPDGCDPAVFAEQCREYLERSAAEKEAAAIEPIVEIEAIVEDEPVVVEEPIFEEEAILGDEPAEEPSPLAHEPEFTDEQDIDLSDLLETEIVAAPVEEEESEPAVYELSANPIEPVDEFDDWQQVVDALKRESERTQLPRRRERVEPAVAAAPPAPEPVAPPAPKVTVPVPAKRKPTQDEWGIFDPTQAGMAALYAKLEQLAGDDDAPPPRPA
jgi:hypothetical protein